jgi:hypothetical protein
MAAELMRTGDSDDNDSDDNDDNADNTHFVCYRQFNPATNKLTVYQKPRYTVELKWFRAMVS